jgi:hypothetical protein
LWCLCKLAFRERVRPRQGKIDAHLYATPTSWLINVPDKHFFLSFYFCFMKIIFFGLFFCAIFFFAPVNCFYNCWGIDVITTDSVNL